MNKLSKNTQLISISELYDLYRLQKLVGVKTENLLTAENKKVMIDTILKGYPLQPILSYYSIENETKRLLLSILTSQDKISTIFDFIESELDNVDLSNEEIDNFWRYKFVFETFNREISEKEMEDIQKGLGI